MSRSGLPENLLYPFSTEAGPGPGQDHPESGELAKKSSGTKWPLWLMSNHGPLFQVRFLWLKQNKRPRQHLNEHKPLVKWNMPKMPLWWEESGLCMQKDKTGNKDSRNCVMVYRSMGRAIAGRRRKKVHGGGRMHKKRDRDLTWVPAMSRLSSGPSHHLT